MPPGLERMKSEFLDVDLSGGRAFEFYDDDDRMKDILDS